MCGEKTVPQGEYNPNWGSPPRVRGKGAFKLLRKPGFRITPACAGKSGEARLDTLLIEDHPRVCGEKDFYDAFSSAPHGSPPRVRGKVVALIENLPQIRITPACAGKRRRYISCQALT